VKERLTKHPGATMKEHVAEIVAAYVGRNRVDPGDLPTLIVSVSRALAGLGQAPVPEPPTPAVPIRRSVSANAITCLDCGWSGQVLKRHLGSAHELTPDEYRARWGLAADYPMVPKGYAARRSEIAKEMGLGRPATSKR
jgi:predicted transcriptional regulator